MLNQVVIEVSVPQTILLAEKIDDVSFARELLLAAVKLYELGRL
jgi:hypothetical protein